MSEERGILGRLKERGEEVFTQLSGELMANPHFMKAMEGAVRGKEMVEEAVTRTLKTMNVPTRSDLKKALSRIEALETEVAGLKKQLKAKARASAPKAKRAGKAKA